MEISVLQGIHNDYIVEYYGMQSEPECLSIFIEFIPMVSFYNTLQTPFNATLAVISYQIINSNEIMV